MVSLRPPSPQHADRCWVHVTWADEKLVRYSRSVRTGSYEERDGRVDQEECFYSRTVAHHGTFVVALLSRNRYVCLYSNIVPFAKLASAYVSILELAPDTISAFPCTFLAFRLVKHFQHTSCYVD